MKTFSVVRFKFAALVAIALSCCFFAACAGQTPDPAAQGQPGANTATQPQQVAPGTPGQAPDGNKVIRPGLGGPDEVTGMVIDPACLKANPQATPEELAACSKTSAQKGVLLVVFGNDRVLYFNDRDPQTTYNQLSAFAGKEVIVEGNIIGDAPDTGIPGVSAKKFKMGYVKKKDLGTKGQVAPKNTNAKTIKTPSK